ncbi:hypothetical protein D3C75_613140 [compost metagenome]
MFNFIFTFHTIDIRENERVFNLEFNAVQTLKDIVNDIEGKSPADLVKYFDEKVVFLKSNDINDKMHIGRTDWTIQFAAEWLLSMFIGIVEKGKEDQRLYNSFGSWLQHAYHFVIDNKAGLK